MLSLVRWVLGKLILFLDAVFPPRSVKRDSETQSKIDRLTQNLVLYQFEACPFCVKVRRVIKKLGLKIELRDAKKSDIYAQELVQGGGELQVPCLRIQDANGSFRWMYESDVIINSLETLAKNAVAT
jgi:glutaredoxin